MRVLPLRPIAWAVCAAAVAAAAAGCGPQKTTVSGRVTYQGKPVVWGNVSLVASDNMNYGAEIKEDGTFTIADVPTGRCKLGVNSPSPQGRTGRGEMRGGLGGGPPAGAAPDDRPKPAAGKWFPIPDKFLDPLSSGLTGEIQAGKPLDVDVK